MQTSKRIRFQFKLNLSEAEFRALDELCAREGMTSAEMLLAIIYGFILSQGVKHQ